jgi:hypothetical protein
MTEDRCQKLVWGSRYGGISHFSRDVGWNSQVLRLRYSVAVAGWSLFFHCFLVAEVLSLRPMGSRFFSALAKVRNAKHLSVSSLDISLLFTEPGHIVSHGG